MNFTKYAGIKSAGLTMVLAAVCFPGLAMGQGAAQATEQPTSPANDPAAALGECFVMKSTGQDRTDLVTWMTVAFASSPKLKGIVTIEPGKKVEADKAVARIFTRLFTVDCQAESKAVMQLPNSSAAFHAAGGRLGMIAAQDLFSDPQANASLADFTQYLDKQAFAGMKP